MRQLFKDNTSKHPGQHIQRGNNWQACFVFDEDREA